MQVAIELALTVGCAVLADMGLEFLAEEKNCWRDFVVEIVRGVAGGREGNIATPPGPIQSKVKVKVTLVQTLRLCTGRTAHRGSRGIALLFHDHGTRRG